MKIGDRSGFTLVELLVVIGIIGILAAVMLAGFRGSTDSARAAKCLTNMRNLATAVQSFGMVEGWYPRAGSIEFVAAGSGGISYYEDRAKDGRNYGWISWLSQGKYGSGNRSTSSRAGSIAVPSLADDDALKENGSTFALTNGALWSYVSQTRETYRCPLHVDKMRGVYTPQWSYAMSSFFSYNRLKRAVVPGAGNRREYGNLASPERKLLFAEIPFVAIGGTGQDNPVTEGGPGTKKLDPILEYDDGTTGSAEAIGFNHLSGKRYTAHVAFADGHTEKLMMPKSGASEGDLKELTKWLCDGAEISFDGRVYRRVVKATSND
ncbi:MAG: type II secretion system protein [Kiritimatiellia bacterium]